MKWLPGTVPQDRNCDGIGTYVPGLGEKSLLVGEQPSGNRCDLFCGDAKQPGYLCRGCERGSV
jgi:hypothetical protein